jgi:hypothetical protein
MITRHFLLSFTLAQKLISAVIDDADALASLTYNSGVFLPTYEKS